jgi:hypothetical protein
MAVANVSCSEIDPDMSCSKASCTTQQTSTEPCEGPQKAGSFRCLQAGFFPDPANCKQFHVCGNDLSHFSGKQPRKQRRLEEAERKRCGLLYGTD